MLLRRVIQQYMNSISAPAAVRITKTAVNCTAAFSIHFAAIFEHNSMANNSICFRGHIAQSTVRKFQLHILPQVQPKLALLLQR